MFCLQKDFLLNGTEAKPSDRPTVFRYLQKFKSLEEEILKVAKSVDYVYDGMKKTKMSLRMWINENVCPTAPYYLFIRVIFLL